MADKKLNQILAIERTVKSRSHSDITELHRVSQKPALFEGFAREYAPKNDQEETYPPENQVVQKRSGEVFKQLRRILTELFDVIVTKDTANQSAKADIMLEGRVLAREVPVTTLIFLEKQLNDINTFISALPELDPSQVWKWDDPTGLWHSNQIISTRTKKVQKALVLVQPTEKHPGQAEKITEDEVVGRWTMVKHSGAVRTADKQEMLERIQKLQKAIKFAREAANTSPARDVSIGQQIFDYILDGK